MDREEDPECYPLDKLLGCAKNLKLYNRVSKKSSMEPGYFDKDIERDMQGISNQLDGLDPSVKATQRVPYGTKASISNTGVASAVKFSLGTRLPSGIRASPFENDEETDEEAEEKAFLKAQEDMDNFFADLGYAFFEGDRDNLGMFFCPYDAQVDNPEEYETVAPNQSETGQHRQDDSGKDKEVVKDHTTHRNYLRVDDDWVHMDDFFGDKWKNQTVS